MQSQFTDKAKTALLLAGRAAKSLHQNYVGTEHILLGLIKEGTGVASRVLTENGAKEEAIREMIQDLLAPETPNPVIERDGYSPRAEEVLEESHRQAEKAGSALTGTEMGIMLQCGCCRRCRCRCRKSCGIRSWQQDWTLRRTAKSWDAGKKRARPGRWSFIAGI